MAEKGRSEIRFAGSGGQGLITGARILFKALSLAGRQAAQSQSYEPTSRGGFCHSDLVVSEGEPDYPLVTGIDSFVVLDQVGADRSKGVINADALVIADERLVPTPPAGGRVLALPLTDRAITIGSHRVANIVALATLVGLTEICPRDALEMAIKAESPKRFVDLNLKAMEEGFRLADAARIAA